MALAGLGARIYSSWWWWGPCEVMYYVFGLYYFVGLSPELVFPSPCMILGWVMRQWFAYVCLNSLLLLVLLRKVLTLGQRLTIVYRVCSLQSIEA